MHYLFVIAERRAQLARSRSRQNILQTPTQSPDVVREINFEDDTKKAPVSSARRQRRPRKENAGDNNNDGDEKVANGKAELTDAEKLIERLKAL